MAFTYDETLPDELSQIRFFIGDTVENSGPRPDSRNFSDEEITAVLDLSNSDQTVAISNLFEVLANEWAKLAASITIGPRKEDYTKVSVRFEQKSREWFVLSGGTVYTTFAAGLVRRTYGADSEHTA